MCSKTQFYPGTTETGESSSAWKLWYFLITYKRVDQNQKAVIFY